MSRTRKNKNESVSWGKKSIVCLREPNVRMAACFGNKKNITHVVMTSRYPHLCHGWYAFDEC